MAGKASEMDKAPEAEKTLSEHLVVLEEILVGCRVTLGINPTVRSPEESTNGARILEMQVLVIGMVDIAQDIQHALSML